jgi:hypothetical protein
MTKGIAVPVGLRANWISDALDLRTALHWSIRREGCSLGIRSQCQKKIAEA